MRKPRRTNLFMLRLTDAEHEELFQRAGEAGVRAATYVRDAALSRAPRVVPPVNQQTAAELSRIGNNLNQIARRLNERAGEDPTTEELVGAYTDLLALLDQVHDQLMRRPA